MVIFVTRDDWDELTARCRNNKWKKIWPHDVRSFSSENGVTHKRNVIVDMAQQVWFEEVDEESADEWLDLHRKNFGN
jgi:hypothetical protein